MTKVTLLIFSGRHDPTWELTAEEATALVRRLAGWRSVSGTSTLGYRGFLVQSDDPGLPSEVIVRDAPELERLLLLTAEGHLSPELIDAVEETIARR